jgi:transcriptional regulator with XRE-family HTH domain
MKTLGQSIRELRKSRGLLIREVAADLGIDPSLLSRIERGDKRPTRAQVVQLSEILDADRSDLLADYLSERVVSALRNEEVALKAISLAEKKIITILLQRRVVDAVP